jgi:hypothetical protein
MADAASPLTPEQREELREANERLDGLRGAAKVAAFNGWTLGFFAAVSILSGLFSLTGLVVGVALAVVARNELVGRRRLLALEPEGPELLWRNQIGLMAVIVAYCLWSIYRAKTASDPGMDELNQVLGEGTDELVQSLTVTVYTVVIFASVLFQGLNARYYHARVARLRAYLDQTPPWVLDVQRTVSSQ